MSQKVFVLVTAKTCPACHMFRRNWEPISVELSKHAKVYDAISLDTSSLPKSREYPKDLDRWIGWFPMFLVFSRKSWDQALAGKGTLDGLIYNGKMTVNGPEPVMNNQPSKDELVEWVRNASFSDRGNSIIQKIPVVALLNNGTQSIEAQDADQRQHVSVKSREVNGKSKLYAMSQSGYSPTVGLYRMGK